MHQSDSRVVDDALFEHQLQLVIAHTTHPCAGIFGPESVSWRIDREAILFLGAGRATLLQLAHPWIAAAMDHHSTVKYNVMERFHRTFRVVFSMVFGTLDHAVHKAQAMHSLHRRISGPLGDAAAPRLHTKHYSANDVDAMLWVYATLVETAAKMYELILHPLTQEEKKQYYRESWLFAFLFGLPESALPPTWSAFHDYAIAMWSPGGLTVSTAGRELSRFLLYGTWEAERYARKQLVRWYRALTLSFLPAHLREQYGFTFGPREQTVADTTLRWIRRIYPHLPAQVRFVPPYHEAIYRLNGGRKPSVLTRRLSALWVGQQTLVL